MNHSHSVRDKGQTLHPSAAPRRKVLIAQSLAGLQPSATYTILFLDQPTKGGWCSDSCIGAHSCSEIVKNDFLTILICWIYVNYLSVAVAGAGGMGAMGALLSSPDAIANWAAEFRSQSPGPFQLNLWIPDLAPTRDFAAEQRVREFLSSWGPTVPAEVSGIRLPGFEKQCDTLITIRPTVVSSIVGVYPKPFVAKLKDHGIAWFACATTLAEAQEAGGVGGDAIGV